MADLAADSDNSEDETATCEKCGADYEVEITNGYGGMLIQIDGIKDEEIEFIVNEGTCDFHTRFLSNLKDIEEMVSTNLPEHLQHIFLNLLFAHVITCMEIYLLDVLWAKIFSVGNQDFFEKFVKNYPAFKEKIQISEVIDTYSGLRKRIQEELTGKIVYHNLPVIRGLFEKTLDIEFPAIDNMMRLINRRHDVIHRGGRDKQKQFVEITRDDIINAIIEVRKFIKEINTQVFPESDIRVNQNHENLDED